MIAGRIACLLLLLSFAPLCARAEVVTRVVVWGDESEKQTDVPKNLSGVTAIAAGDFHALALLKDGTVVGWGDNQSGQATPPVGLKDVKAIAAGGFHSIALRKDGSVIAWGRNDFGQCRVPREVNAAIAVAAGQNHSLALLYNGRVVAWGNNAAGQCDVPAELPNAASVAALGDWSCAFLPSGSRADWGNMGQRPLRAPSHLAQANAIAASTHHGIALLKDGNLAAWGSNEFGQASIPQGLKKARSIAAGKTFSMALVELESQDVRITPLGSIFFQDKPLAIPAEASSHLPVTFTSSDPETVSFEDDKLVCRRAGVVTITATQPGNNQYAAASAITLLRVILGQRHMKYFAPIPPLHLGMHPLGVELKAKASAGTDPIVFTSSNPNVARIEGHRLYTTGIGRARISAQAKQSAQYQFTPALYQTVEVSLPSDEQLLKRLFANRTFEGEANFKTSAGSTEKISYQYNVAFDGAIFGQAQRMVWAPPSSENNGSSTGTPSGSLSKIRIHGSIKPPFSFEIDSEGRIIAGTGVNSLLLAKGLFAFGPIEFRNGNIQFRSPVKSIPRGYVTSGTCSSTSEAAPARVSLHSP
jgi:hypothetical protein